MLLPYQNEKTIAELLPYLTAAEFERLNKLTADTKINTVGLDYAKYKDDPVGFGVELFGEFYTPDQIRVAESVRDNPITIAESANATGKTHISARIALWWYKTRDYAQVYTAAAPPLENLMRLMWGEINALTTIHADTVFKEDRVNFLNISPAIGSKRSIEDPKSFITGVPIPMAGSSAQREAKFSGKHAKHLLFILDEGDAIPYEVYKGIESCLSGGIGRLLVMYNPRSDEGPIADYKNRGVKVVRLSAFDHPNVITGEDRYPGAVTRNKTLHRINRWTIAADEPGNEDVTGYGRFAVPDFLVGIPFTDEETGDECAPILPGERIIIEPKFSYMVLGLYPGQSQGVILDTWLDDYDKAIENGRLPEGNVTELADFEPGAGDVIWSIDDGYVGRINPQTKQFTGDSHPRVILKAQVKNGVICVFDELAKIREPHPENQIREAADVCIPFDPSKVTEANADLLFPMDTVIRLSHATMPPGKLWRSSSASMILTIEGQESQQIAADQFFPFCARAVLDGITMAMEIPAPEFVVVGPGSSLVAGILQEMDYFTRNSVGNVEEGIKVLRHLVSKDTNGRRRFLVHPRCKLFRYEAVRYKRDEHQRIIKEFDHTQDSARYLCLSVEIDE